MREKKLETESENRIKIYYQEKTMKKDYTHICIVLDASGSMECIENDIKGSFNTFLKKHTV